MKNAVLLLTNKDSNTILHQYNKLKNELDNNIYDIILLFHSNEKIIPERFKDIDTFLITDEIFLELNFRAHIGRSIGGNEFFTMMKFFNENKQYDYYWFLEDDVRFSGDWSILFNAFEEKNYDFLSASIRWASDDLEWNGARHMGKFTNNINDKEPIPFEEKLAAFNPIYRISKRANQFMFEKYSDGWYGWHEILITTLLYKHGYSIVDFGGNGIFVPNETVDKFYYGCLITHKTPISKEELLARDPNKPRTHTWRPIFKEIGPVKNVIYHPVKDF